MTTMRSVAWMGAASAVVLGVAQSAMAHAGHDPGAQTLGASLAAGAMHPVLGLDHLLAMLASGLVAVRAAQRRALWAVPAAFAGLMVAGGGLAWAGAPLPAAEWGIALSVIVLGLAAAALPVTPTWAAAAMVGLFAVCHGHAHVAELGGHAVLPYVLGFVASTLALHAVAIAAGLALKRADRPMAVRFAGGAIAAAFTVVLALGV